LTFPLSSVVFFFVLQRQKPTQTAESFMSKAFRAHPQQGKGTAIRHQPNSVAAWIHMQRAFSSIGHFEGEITVAGQNASANEATRMPGFGYDSTKAYGVAFSNDANLTSGGEVNCFVWGTPSMNRSNIVRCSSSALADGLFDFYTGAVATFSDSVIEQNAIGNNVIFNLDGGSARVTPFAAALRHSPPLGP
jgi:hypothetical protein